MKYRIVVLLLTLALLCGCSGQPSGESADKAGDPVQTTGATAAPESTQGDQKTVYTGTIDTAQLFSSRDRDASYDVSKSAQISLQGTAVSCSSDAVQISGNAVTIRDEGTYLLQGNLDNGMIIVDADKEDKVQLVLCGVTVHSETSAPIYIRQADKVFITLQEGSVNTLSNGGNFTAIDKNNIDAVIFSKEDLTLNGTGSLTVNSPAGHGIVSKDELTVTEGKYTLTTASHGLCGRDSVCIADATMVIDAGKDGMQADHDEDTTLGFLYIGGGDFTIEAEGDGISASSVIQIDGGSFSITTGGGSVNAEQKTSDAWGGFGGGPGGMGGRPGGMGERPGGVGGRPGGGGIGGNTTTTEDSTSIKALKAAADLTINGGTFVIDAADDAVHSNANVIIGGGSLTIATGDDGLHADSKLMIAAGKIVISESYEGLEGLCIEIAGGDITLTASDDGLNAAGGNDESGFGGFRGGDMFTANADSYITISGGTLFANAAGDGIDSNGNLTVSGGYTVVEGPTDGGNGPLDYAGNASISGGTLIVTGSMQMAQSIGADGQGVLGVSVGNQSGGTKIEVIDSEGKVLVAAQPSKAYSCVVVSCPRMVSGETYTLNVGTLTGELQAN